jgi:hypothetical protein
MVFRQSSVEFAEDEYRESDDKRDAAVSRIFPNDGHHRTMVHGVIYHMVKTYGSWGIGFGLRQLHHPGELPDKVLPMILTQTVDGFDVFRASCFCGCDKKAIMIKPVVFGYVLK